ncbi:DNA cytosine methyltransferase [Pseudoalteromonas sp. AS71]|uniref:DNA cytosine methyltransferase n=1 Tax=Pseudoalteromonas sp. AS71 TaxID=3135777 RepID=UPI0031729BCA
MKNKPNTILKAEALLKPLAIPHVPQESDVEALIDQWLHAIATDSQLFCRKELASADNLKKEVVACLVSEGLFTDRLDFFNQVFGELELKPSVNGSFKFIDLFAGIGGMRLGFQQNGGTCVFSSEFDKFAQGTYKLNHGELPLGDITKINEEDIPDHDVLLAGFPCQPFSYSGLCEGFEDKTRGTLFFDVLRILESKRPKVALLENVKGFKSHDKGETMFIALKALDEAGYVPFWTILNSFDYGVPQYRERWFCVAMRKDIASNFEFPSSEGRNTTLRDIVDLEESGKVYQLTDFEKERVEYHFSRSSLEERVKHDSSKYEPHTKKGKHGVFSFQKADGALRFHVGDVAKTQIQEAFYACLDTYAPTIIANRVPKLWDIGRKLTVHESLLLQGFPSSFKFETSNAQSYKQLGNSVTVSVIDRLAKKIKEYL